MKEHVIRTWCDACVGEDGTGRTEGETHAVRIDGSGAELDLCEHHNKEMIEPLMALIKARGVPVKSAGVSTKSTANKRCPICNLEMTATGITNHVYNIHVPGGQPERPTRCPDCGFTSDARAVGAHRRGAHGYDALGEAVARARAAA